MKREAWNHPKFKLLGRDLGIPLCFVRGVLESIWTVAATNFPRGDIGRLTNEEIAVAIDYPDDADKLIEAMVSRRLLDRSDEHRLIVHDWPDHADDAVHYKLARAGLSFADGTESRRKKPAKTDDGQSATVGDCRRQSETGCQSQSQSQSQPNIGGKPQPKRKPEPKQRPRDEVFDALAKVHGLNLSEITNGAGGMLAKAKADIIAVTPNVTAQEIYRRFGILKRHRPDPTNHTAPNLAKLWGMCGDPARAGPPESSPSSALKQNTEHARRLMEGKA